MIQTIVCHVYVLREKVKTQAIEHTYDPHQIDDHTIDRENDHHSNDKPLTFLRLCGKRGSSVWPLPHRSFYSFFPVSVPCLPSPTRRLVEVKRIWTFAQL